MKLHWIADWKSVHTHEKYGQNGNQGADEEWSSSTTLQWTGSLHLAYQRSLVFHEWRSWDAEIHWENYRGNRCRFIAANWKRWVCADRDELKGTAETTHTSFDLLPQPAYLRLDMTQPKHVINQLFQIAAPLSLLVLPTWSLPSSVSSYVWFPGNLSVSFRDARFSISNNDRLLYGWPTTIHPPEQHLNRTWSATSPARPYPILFDVTPPLPPATVLMYPCTRMPGSENN